MALPMLKSLMTCLGATPFWPLLAWIIFVVSSTLLIVGMAKIFNPFSWDDVETAADLRSALGTASEAAVIVGVVSVFNLMMTERTLSYKTALRYRSCSAPFYGTKCCQPGGGKCANFMAVVCKFYPFVTLLLTARRRSSPAPVVIGVGAVRPRAPAASSLGPRRPPGRRTPWRATPVSHCGSARGSAGSIFFLFY